jgi:hypothetical protein
MWCALAVVLVAGTACHGEGRRSSTPPLVDDPSASHDTFLLLTEADVRSVAGLQDVTAESLADAEAFENPDPRGPCGAPVPPLPKTGIYGRTFRGDGVAIFELLQPATAATRAYAEALKADSRPSCPPYTSTTNLGDVQHVSDVEILDLPTGCTRCVGWLAKLVIAGQTNYAGLVTFESAGTVGMLQIGSATPVSPATVRDLLARALSRLDV